MWGDLAAGPVPASPSASPHWWRTGAEEHFGAQPFTPIYSEQPASDVRGRRWKEVQVIRPRRGFNEEILITAEERCHRRIVLVDVT